MGHENAARSPLMPHLSCHTESTDGAGAIGPVWFVVLRYG